MSHEAVLPYEQLVDSMHTKLEGLGPYQQTDCTEEFNVISTELFGGNIFGENGVAKCGKSSDGPAVYFYDRVLEGRAAHGSYPLQVAALNKDGFHIAQDTVLVDWLCAREVCDDGNFAYAGEREAIANSPFSLKGIDKETLKTLTPKLATARIAARAALFAAEDQIAARKISIAHVASKLGDYADAADIAEVVGTESQIIPYVLRSPNRSSAMEALKGDQNHDLDCGNDGIWVAIAPGRLAIRSEVFIARDTYRDKALGAAEEHFWGLSGQRIVMAVGRTFDSGEKERLLSNGKLADAANRRFMGPSYGSPYDIDPSVLPNGVLARGSTSGVNYRVFIAK